MSARQDYVLEVAARLWPDSRARVAAAKTAAPGDRAFVFLPPGPEPRIVLPGSARAAAVTGARGFGGGGRGARARARGVLVSMALSTGVASRLSGSRLLVSGEPGIDDWLAGELGGPLLVALQVSPPRANRKPVLQLLTPAGARVGYVKVGVNDLTRALVRSEATALATLATAGLAATTVPAVLLAGPWRDVDVLVMAPLPAPVADARPTAAQNAASMVEVAQVGGVVRGRIDGSEFLDGLLAALDGLGADGSALAGSLRDRFGSPGGSDGGSDGSDDIGFGAWHGDWTPWNCAVSADGTLLVWDWERFTTGVPLGFDALHNDLMTRLAGVTEPTPAHAHALVAAARDLLAPFGPAADPEGVALLYLAELAHRYLADGQEATGNRLGRVGTWLVPAVLQTSGAGQPSSITKEEAHE